MDPLICPPLEQIFAGAQVKTMMMVTTTMMMLMSSGYINSSHIEQESFQATFQSFLKLLKQMLLFLTT